MKKAETRTHRAAPSFFILPSSLYILPSAFFVLHPVSSFFILHSAFFILLCPNQNRDKNGCEFARFAAFPGEPIGWNNLRLDEQFQPVRRFIDLLEAIADLGDKLCF